MRQFFSVVLGILVLNILSVISIGIPGITGSKIFIANFIGGICAGYISKKNGVILGLITSIVSCLIAIATLVLVAERASGGGIFFPPLNTMALEYVSILLGPAGGYFGVRLSHLTSKNI